MAGRSLTAGTGLEALAGVQSPPRSSIAFSRQGGGLMRPALMLLCGRGEISAWLSAGGDGNRINASDGASAMACMGSGSGLAVKMVTPLRPATKPKIKNTRTNPTLRHNFGPEPI